MTTCPYCDFEAADTDAEVAHMKLVHPDVIAERLAAIGEPSPVTEADRAQRAAWVAGVQHGIDATLGMVATAYGIEYAEPLRDTAIAYGEMLKKNDA